jgi:hypothetical protein
MSPEHRRIVRRVTVSTALTLPSQPTGRIEPGTYVIDVEPGTDRTTGTEVAVSARLLDPEGRVIQMLGPADLDLFIRSDSVRLEGPA